MSSVIRPVAADAETSATTKTRVRRRAPAGFWRAATANRKVTLGLIIVVFFVLLALCGPALRPV